MTSFVYHHLGLGDHIICNGLVREIAKKYGHVLLACKPHNMKNVQRMYRDTRDIEVFCADDDDAKRLLQYFRAEKVVSTFHISIYPTELQHPDLSFDELFYKCANIDFQKRFDSFYVEEDEEAQNAIYAELNPNDEPYIFVHDDVTRGFQINPLLYKSGTKVIKNDMRFSVFDMKKVLLNAKEIHCMPSCIHDFCNSFVLKPPMHVYMNVRGYDKIMLAKSMNERVIKW